MKPTSARLLVAVTIAVQSEGGLSSLLSKG